MGVNVDSFIFAPVAAVLLFGLFLTAVAVAGMERMEEQVSRTGQNGSMEMRGVCRHVWSASEMEVRNKEARRNTGDRAVWIPVRSVENAQHLDRLWIGSNASRRRRVAHD